MKKKLAVKLKSYSGQKLQMHTGDFDENLASKIIAIWQTSANISKPIMDF